MNEEVKEKWFKALYSGEYLQGTGGLRDSEDNFCCLGVLCDLYIQEHKDVKWQPQDSGYYCLLHEDEFLPSPIREWAGLDEVDPEVEVKEKTFRVSLLNDGGYSFKDIADLIKESL